MRGLLFLFKLPIILYKIMNPKNDALLGLTFVAVMLAALLGSAASIKYLFIPQSSNYQIHIDDRDTTNQTTETRCFLLCRQ